MADTPHSKCGSRKGVRVRVPLPAPMKDWIVYLLQCSDGTYYCGVTNNMEKRLRKHNAGKGAKYTRGRLPVVLVCCRDGLTKSEALKFEAKIKRLKRAQKIAAFKRA